MFIEAFNANPLKLLSKINPIYLKEIKIPLRYKEYT